jgi:nitroreductase
LSATARAELGEALALDWADQDTPEPSKLDKVRTKYQRAPVVVVAASTAGDSAQRTMENRDAVAAGLQNLLLGAAAVGLASLWSSPPVRRSPRTEALCGFPTGVELVAVVYLGWPAGSVETPERPPVALTWRS